MKNKAFVFVSVVLISGIALAGTYSGGTGEPDDPYLISTTADLDRIGAEPNDWDKHFLLTNHINLYGYSGTDFNLIGRYAGPYEPNNKPFTGVFDGDGHVIYNFTYETDNGGHIGLFAYVDDPNALIKDVGLMFCHVDGGDALYVGSLVGRMSRGTISGCCSRRGYVAGREGVGGLVGALGGVYGEPGGPEEDSVVRVVNCYATNEVTGIYGAGGLIGIGGFSRDYSRYVFWISNCYAAGAVTDQSPYVGGLIGQGDAMPSAFGTDSGIVSCFWDVDSSGVTTSAGGTGKTTEQMRSRHTFGGWGCDPAWTINDGVDYPRLMWENTAGELITKPVYGGGQGTAEEPYLIYTAEQLNMVGPVTCDMDKHFRLMADINLADYSGTEFNMIGNQQTPFGGVFDGNGKKIYNFSYQGGTWDDCVGLFGYVKGPAEQIKDLGLVEPNIVSIDAYSTGALAGSVVSGVIRNCYVEGGSVSGPDRIGGLMGESTAEYLPTSDVGLVEDCRSSCRVDGHNYVGGLIGTNYCRMERCYSSGEVSGDSRVGGLVGCDSGMDAKIVACYATGAVQARRFVGGLVGSNESGKIYDSYASGNVSARQHSAGGVTGIASMGWLGYRPYFYRCYATGEVTGDLRVGGFLGQNLDDKTRFYDCFWDHSVNPSLSGVGTTDPDPGDVIGKATADLQRADTYTGRGWNFESVWEICEGTNYPKLVWQTPVMGDVACPDGVELNDFATVAEHWLALKCGASDVDGDCRVDFRDLQILCEHWLEGTE